MSTRGSLPRANQRLLEPPTVLDLPSPPPPLISSDGCSHPSPSSPASIHEDSPPPSYSAATGSNFVRNFVRNSRNFPPLPPYRLRSLFRRPAHPPPPISPVATLNTTTVLPAPATVQEPENFLDRIRWKFWIFLIVALVGLGVMWYLITTLSATRHLDFFKDGHHVQLKSAASFANGSLSITIENFTINTTNPNQYRDATLSDISIVATTKEYDRSSSPVLVGQAYSNKEAYMAEKETGQIVFAEPFTLVFHRSNTREMNWCWEAHRRYIRPEYLKVEFHLRFIAHIDNFATAVSTSFEQKIQCTPDHEYSKMRIIQA